MSTGDVTRALAECRGGDPEALERLFGLVYGRMRRIARRQLGSNATGVVLDTGALVHEAYLKMIDPTGIDWADGAHFFAVAARSMRQIVVDHVRARRADKRPNILLIITDQQPRGSSYASRARRWRGVRSICSISTALWRD